jgi:hypothetical protein
MSQSRNRMSQSGNRIPRRPAMLALASSSISAAGYDKRHALRLWYMGGGTYDYWDVPAGVFQALLDAPSKERFVNWQIKPRYRFTRVN